MPNNNLDAFRIHLTRIGLLDSGLQLPMRLLGGWLKMGIVGTRAAEGKVLFVGDAAGLVNPLQGEGIAQALASGQAAANVVADSTGSTPRPRTASGLTRRTASGHRSPHPSMPDSWDILA